MSTLLKAPIERSLNASSSLYDDWGIDSLQAFELILLTEQLAGLDMPPIEIPVLFLIGDAYEYYQECWKSSRDAAE